MRRLLACLVLAGLALFAGQGPTVAQGAAALEPPVCRGRDLIEGMDAAGRAEIDRLAAKVVNGERVFWRIEPPNGAPPSFLLGTMHLSDPRVTTLKPAVEAAFAGARVVALENTSILDPSAARDAYAKVLDQMIYTDGRTLPAVLGAEDWGRVREALKARGLPAWAVASWRPWMVVFGVLLYPDCELKRWMAKLDILDAALGRRARAAGKPALDLETTEEQFQAINAISEADQIALLRSLVAMDGMLVDVVETQTRLYLDGRIDKLWAVANTLMLDANSERVAAAVLTHAAYRRNHGMVARAKPLIDEGNAFLAVGALHLVGEEGLVALLRREGYSVTPGF